jgi:hypothetical protein
MSVKIPMSDAISYPKHPKEHAKVLQEIRDYLKFPRQKEKLKKARVLLGLPSTDKESSSRPQSASAEETA